MLRRVARRAVVATRHTERAFPDAVWVDVDAFRAAADRARRDGDPEAYQEAVDLYRDGLLPDDRYEDWALGAQDELNIEFIALVEELAGLLESRGDIAGAARAVVRLIAAEPLLEEAHVSLMRLHALAGRRGEALRAYEHLAKVLRSELDAEPSPTTQRLYEEIRTRQNAEPELTAELWERVGELRVVSNPALAEQAEAARAQAFAWCLLGESLLLHAHWDEAAGCLERSCELHEALGGTRSGALPWQRLGELAVSRGEPGDGCWAAAACIDDRDGLADGDAPLGADPRHVGARATGARGPRGCRARGARGRRSGGSLRRLPELQRAAESRRR